jgi:hypothetical protein
LFYRIKEKGLYVRWNMGKNSKLEKYKNEVSQLQKKKQKT